MNPIMIFSSSSGFICPCPIATRQSGTYFSIISFSSMSFDMRSTTTYACPLRLISKLMASAMVSPLKVTTSVCIGYRLGGGVRMMLMSRAPISENCRVRGIGVALIVSVSTFTFSWRSFSLVLTPNFCSSSMMSRPRSCHFTVLEISLCVPTTMSVLPSLRSSSNCLVSLAERALLR